MGNHARIKVITGLILCSGLLFLHCSDDPIGGHLLDQPFSKENYVFPGTVVDPAGSPVQGVSVSMDYAYLYENQATPFALTKKTSQNSPVQIIVVIKIYNLFNDLVKSLENTFNAWDTLGIDDALVWDQTDMNGNKVLPGIFYYNQFLYDAYNGQELSSKTYRWFPVAGTIDTTDADGRFLVPALPVQPVRLDFKSSSGSGLDGDYFKGWITLTCEKNGYQTKTDTVYVFEEIPPIVIRKVP